MVLVLETMMIIVMLELMAPWDDQVKEAFGWKREMAGG